MKDKQARIDFLVAELKRLDKILAGNPLNSAANATYKVYQTKLAELLK